MCSTAGKIHEVGNVRGLERSMGGRAKLLLPEKPCVSRAEAKEKILLQVLKEGRLGPGVLLGVAMPLISQLIVEGRGGEAMGHELKEADKDR